MKRFLARQIIFSGSVFRLSVAEFSDDFSSVEIYPFAEEIASTVFLDGTIEIKMQGGKYVIECDGRILSV